MSDLKFSAGSTTMIVGSGETDEAKALAFELFHNEMMTLGEFQAATAHIKQRGIIDMISDAFREVIAEEYA